jgi:multicomponent Na+:H+ antiporter subunit C
MDVLLALLAGLLSATGVYLLLQRSLLRMVFGIILLSNAANLVLLAAGRTLRAAPPIVPEGLAAPTEAVANPLPQALVLTAIVIGFGLAAFAFALLYRTYLTFGTLDADVLAAAPDASPGRGPASKPEDAPAPEAPASDAPASDAPASDAPASDAPASGAPAGGAPDSGASSAGSPPAERAGR